jgi:kynurenine formamidase
MRVQAGGTITFKGGIMPAVVDPVSGLQFYELSHPWGYYTPIQPGYEDIKLERVSHHARHGAMAQRFSTIMHVSTHLNAPIHLVQRAVSVGNLPLERFFGTGVVVSIPKQKWELIGAKDLEATTPAIKDGDIVLIVTGWHRHYSDSIRYFGHAPGLAKDAAEWLAARKLKLVGIDTAMIDHPLATSLGPHRNGPQIKYLLPEYKKATGRDAIQDFPDWNPAHRTLLAAGIPTIENVGGDIAEVVGKRCTFQAFPWKWTEGDACVIRLVGIVDPKGGYRLESGAAN